MTAPLLDPRHLEFLLHEWLDVVALTARPRFEDHSRGTFDDVVTLAQRLAEDHFAPHRRRSDIEEPHLVDGKVTLPPEVATALARFADSGLGASTVDAELGGFQLPHVVHQAAFLWLSAGNVGTAAYPMLTMANAHLLIAHASTELIERYVGPMLEGRFFGTMCLSEPDIGSSLGDLTTSAVQAPDGTYRVTGTKMWISGGEHELSENIVHLVLARTGSPSAGTRALSLFVVPRLLVDDNGTVGQPNRVELVGLNHKMGYRGMVNTVLAFGGRGPDGREEGAVGYLVGAEGDGLAGMFHMMNEARIGVGAGAVALSWSAYLYALDYARDRRQGRLPGTVPGGEQVPIVRHADVRRMLLASKCYVEGGAALVLYAARVFDDAETGDSIEDRAEAALLLDVLTPVVKTWPSQWGLVANDHAIQVLGGAGYVRDHPVEQLYRDNRLNPIHEGTFGIQANDLLGRKVRVADGAGLRVLLGRIRATADRATGELADHGARLRGVADRVETVTTGLWADHDRSAVLANAGAYLEVVGHLVVAWLWLEQALVAQGKQGGFYDGKLLAADYFFRHELPRTGPLLDLLASGDRTLVDLDDDLL